jgi:hypothetical protein
MNRSKHDLPQSMAMPEAYKLLLKRERMQKPALIKHRKEIHEHMQRQNYKLEYERILGLLEGHAQRFNTPGGHFQKDKLINRLQMLKKMFHEVHHQEKHPIEQK